MKRFPLPALLALMIAALACGGTAPVADVKPTATLVIPSDTPAPTDTPMPTDTPPPPPTATPDTAATAAVLATQSASDVSAELDTWLGGSDVPYKDGHLMWQQTETVKIDMTGPQDDNFREIGENLTAGNFIFKSDVTWEASGVLICGLIFRSERHLIGGKQYQFYFYRLSGLPAYFIDVYEFGEFKNTITDERFSKDLDVSNGGTNKFMLVAQDNQFNVYINGNRQSRFFDDSKQRAEGYLAFLAWQESGTGSCQFENSWVWSLD
jgi:hypothetical protein